MFVAVVVYASKVRVGDAVVGDGVSDDFGAKVYDVGVGWFGFEFEAVVVGTTCGGDGGDGV